MKTFGQIILSVAITAPLFVLLFGNPTVLQKPILGLSLNLLVMCWWVIVVTIWQHQPSMPAGYYRIGKFEKDGKLYEWLGVRLAKAILRRGPLSVFNPNIKLVPGERDFQKLANHMQAAETAHAFLFVIVFVLTLYPLINGWWAAVASWTIFNILINAYPVMLQRYNRARLQPLLNRKKTAAEYSE
ncbi:MAG TPA: hypothetical protein DDW52_26435 [Planctomycetaceae bacterium]|nr:hypothetical protein [Planctomycetaceae bacterium]